MLTYVARGKQFGIVNLHLMVLPILHFRISSDNVEERILEIEQQILKVNDKIDDVEEKLKKDEVGKEEKMLLHVLHKEKIL